MDNNGIIHSDKSYNTYMICREYDIRETERYMVLLQILQVFEEMEDFKCLWRDGLGL